MTKKHEASPKTWAKVVDRRKQRRRGRGVAALVRETAPVRDDDGTLATNAATLAPIQQRHAVRVGAAGKWHDARLLYAWHRSRLEDVWTDPLTRAPLTGPEVRDVVVAVQKNAHPRAIDPFVAGRVRDALDLTTTGRAPASVATVYVRLGPDAVVVHGIVAVPHQMVFELAQDGVTLSMVVTFDDRFQRVALATAVARSRPGQQLPMALMAVAQRIKTVLETA